MNVKTFFNSLVIAVLLGTMGCASGSDDSNPELTDISADQLPSFQGQYVVEDGASFIVNSNGTYKYSGTVDLNVATFKVNDDTSQSATSWASGKCGWQEEGKIKILKRGEESYLQLSPTDVKITSATMSVRESAATLSTEDSFKHCEKAALAKKQKIKENLFEDLGEGVFRFNWEDQVESAQWENKPSYIYSVEEPGNGYFGTIYRKKGSGAVNISKLLLPALQKNHPVLVGYDASTEPRETLSFNGARGMIYANKDCGATLTASVQVFLNEANSFVIYTEGTPSVHFGYAERRDSDAYKVCQEKVKVISDVLQKEGISFGYNFAYLSEPLNFRLNWEPFYKISLGYKE